MSLIFFVGVATGQTIETPWGPITTHQRDMACAADHVYIGRITHVWPFIPMDGFFPSQINSTVRFQVERNIRASGSNFIIQLPGGVLENVRHLVEGYPIPLVGRRYFMVVDRWPADQPPAQAGDLRYFFSVALDANAPLPGLADMKAALSSICTSGEVSE